MHRQLIRTAKPAPSAAKKSCGHERHVGHCPVCQRIQLERWSVQLAQVRPVQDAERN